ncbi:MAG TPA: FecR domain-containing protein [Puia sp.]|nr:FecR domain-containing protein [Puia sp.]
MSAELSHIATRAGQPGPTSRAKIRPLFRYTAAITLILLAAAAYIGRQYTLAAKKQVAASPTTAAPTKNDALPGHNGAILTLADERQIVLDSLHEGMVTTQGQTIVLIKNGQLAYAAREIRGICGAEFGPLHNTLSTPKGRQYRFTLPDGTQVWLNAASSITYPTEFCGKDRTVSLRGEAYFEVTKDSTRPFRINTNNTEVEALDTNVDIDVYSDKDVLQTTLLKGNVKVKNTTSAVLLRPGQQASLDPSSGTAQLRLQEHVNLDEITAWKKETN